MPIPTVMLMVRCLSAVVDEDDDDDEVMLPKKRFEDTLIKVDSLVKRQEQELEAQDVEPGDSRVVSHVFWQSTLKFVALFLSTCFGGAFAKYVECSCDARGR